jgi:hypothetical protein
MDDLTDDLVFPVSLEDSEDDNDQDAGRAGRSKGLATSLKANGYEFRRSEKGSGARRTTQRRTATVRRRSGTRGTLRKTMRVAATTTRKMARARALMALGQFT